MPGTLTSISIFAFDLNERGDPIQAWETVADVTEAEAVEQAKELARRHAGALVDRVPPGSLIAVVKLVAAGIAGQAHGSLRGRHLTASSWRWIGSVDQCGVRGYLDEPALAFLGSVLTAPSS